MSLYNGFGDSRESEREGAEPWERGDGDLPWQPNRVDDDDKAGWRGAEHLPAPPVETWPSPEADLIERDGLPPDDPA